MDGSGQLYGWRNKGFDWQAVLVPLMLLLVRWFHSVIL